MAPEKRKRTAPPVQRPVDVWGDTKIVDAGDKMQSALQEHVFYTVAPGRLGAKSFCIACFHAEMSGSAGDSSKFSLRPESSSGICQRKLDRPFQRLPKVEPMILQIPIQRHQANREIKD
eukprot:5612526-Pyramimonas_sp.AAC.1